MHHVLRNVLRLPDSDPFALIGYQGVVVRSSAVEANEWSLATELHQDICAQR